MDICLGWFSVICRISRLVSSKGVGRLQERIQDRIWRLYTQRWRSCLFFWGGEEWMEGNVVSLEFAMQPWLAWTASQVLRQHLVPCPTEGMPLKVKDMASSIYSLVVGMVRSIPSRWKSMLSSPFSLWRLTGQNYRCIFISVSSFKVSSKTVLSPMEENETLTHPWHLSLGSHSSEIWIGC